jgi:GntR family transcriptional regulator, negative regulator for fad regulon and positive regulator of fabA
MVHSKGGWVTIMTLKPSISAEQQILAGIQSGMYPIGSNLPPERELALALQVTRPTLREVLQRLARDGWLDIHHGRPTKVRNYLEDGYLTILSTLAEKMEEISVELIDQILNVRLLLAPTYTRLAITYSPEEVEKFTQKIEEGIEDPVILANTDFLVQKLLSRLSKNTILALTINNLELLYTKAMASIYQEAEARKQARVYFRMIYKAARAVEPDAAEAVTRRVMQESINNRAGKNI